MQKHRRQIEIASKSEKIACIRACENTPRVDENIGECLNLKLGFLMLSGCFLGVF
jgi:hypothetical protein